MATETRTGGRAATDAVIGGGLAIAVGKPSGATPDGFSWRRLSDLARLETGHTPSRRHPEYWDGGIPWIGIRDATGNHGRTIDRTLQTVTQEGIDNSSARLLPAGTVCLSRTASVGYVVVMGVPMATSQDFVNWVCGPGLDPRYLKYVLQADREALLRFANGSTHQTIYFPEVKAFHALLPSIEQQRAIAATLGALDDKIESNRRAQRLGEQLMRSHVQLMLRNAEGREHARLSDFCSKAGEGVSQAKLESEAAYVGLENMPRGSLWLHTVGTTLGLGSNKSRFHCGDVLFGKLRPYFRKVAIAPVNGVCSTDILVLRPHEPQDLALVSVVASSDDLIESVTSSATGTRMPRTSWSDLASWPLPTFNRRDREQLGAVTAPVIKGMLNLTRESHALAAIRDCLLPELIAGRIPMISSESSVRASDRL